MRELKTQNADAKAIEAEVALLKQLKEDYKKLTGKDVPGAKKDSKPTKTKKEGSEDSVIPEQDKGGKGGKKGRGRGIGVGGMGRGGGGSTHVSILELK